MVANIPLIIFRTKKTYLMTDLCSQIPNQTLAPQMLINMSCWVQLAYMTSVFMDSDPPKH